MKFWTVRTKDMRYGEEKLQHWSREKDALQHVVRVVQDDRNHEDNGEDLVDIAEVDLDKGTVDKMVPHLDPNTFKLALLYKT